jgi:putative nucleotidyltransferase with HDIG domain
MPAAELIVIADDRGRLALPKRIANGALKIVDWRDIGGLSSIGEASVLIDVDLQDLSKVKMIKDNLPARAGNQCRIVAVDHGSHFSRVQANGLGASDLLVRPLTVHELMECLQRRHRRREQTEDRGVDQQAVKREPADASIASAAGVLEKAFRGLTSGEALDLPLLERAGEQVLDAIGEVGLAEWLATVRRYHESTFQHCLIVTGVLTAFGHRNGMRKADVATLTIAGLLHDVGKARVPLDILDKPGRLTDAEFALIKQHPIAGYEYLRGQAALSSETLRAVRHHHEYLDGSGYPDGLAGHDIDDLTRIVTVCDVYGALIEKRAYKAPKSPDAALDILVGMARGGKIENDLVRALRYCVLQ